MRVPQTGLQKIKTGVHFAQALFIFITGCLCLGVLTRSGGSGGGTDFMFGLCFLTTPALVYQVMVPAWSRAWRFANVYAYATVDALLTILWLAAAIAVGVWNSHGMQKGASADKDTKPSCATFAYGSEAKCNTSKASVGFGVLVFLMFGVTTGLAIHGVMEYRRTGIMPNAGAHTDLRHAGGHASEEDPNKDPWSTDADDLDPYRRSENPFRHIDNTSYGSDPRVMYGQHFDDDDEERLLQQQQQQPYGNDFRVSRTEDNLAHPGRLLSYSPKSPVAYEQDVTSSALSPQTYAHSPDGRINFPEANHHDASISR